MKDHVTNIYSIKDVVHFLTISAHDWTSCKEQGLFYGEIKVVL